MYLTYLILLGLTIIANSVLMVILYRRTQKNVTSVTLVILLILITIWFTPKFLTNALHPNRFWFETFSRVSALGYVFTSVMLVVFSLSYGMYNKVFQKFLFWLLLLVPAFIILYLSWTTNLVSVHDYSTAILYPWGYETPVGILWPYYLIWCSVLVLIATIVLIHFYTTMIDHRKKGQVLYIISAVVFPFIINTVAVGVLPIFHIFLMPIGLILLDIMTVIGISIIYHYGLFEVNSNTILSNIKYAIISVDKSGTILQVNSFAEKLFRKDSSRIVGLPLEKVFYVHNKQQKHRNNYCMRLLHPALSRGKSMTYETYSMSLQNTKNKLITPTISVTPIYVNNAIAGATIFIRDTTKEKEREKQKDDFYSILSHELKNPITSIKAFNQILYRKLSHNEEEKKIILRVNDQLDKLTRLINDFFELSRLQTGKLKIEKEIFAIDDFINNIIDTMRITYKERQFHIQGSTGSVVYADKNKIEQIIINLIHNALKFSTADKEIVLLLLANERSVTIGVKDYGKGIDPKFHKKVFDRFFQIKHTSQEKTGLGIGLFISSTIIKAHEGRIWVESKLGKGSTFYFTLPRS